MNARLKTHPARFRQMSEADVDNIMAIELMAYPFPWSGQIFTDCIRAGYACFVLERDMELVAYGVLSAAAGEAHILNVCVRPEAQGEGLGRRMLRRLIDAARWHRADRVFLEVRPSNPNAIALYDSEGFNEIARRPNYYPAHKGREDAIIMALELLGEEG